MPPLPHSGTYARIPIARRRLQRPAGLASAALILCSFAVHADLDAEHALELVRSGAILPLEQILARVRQTRAGTLIELKLHHEREHDGYVYEVMLLGTDGQLWEIELDAVTGEVVEQEIEKD